MLSLVQQALVERKLDMSVRREKRYGTWFYRKWVRKPDGRKVRIFGTPKAEGLPDTRAGAEEAERRAINRVMETGEPNKPVVVKKEVPTVRAFHEVFLAASRIVNKPSSVDTKEMIFRVHILPRLGDLRLDEVTYAVIEDFKIALSETPVQNVEKTYGIKKARAKGKTTDAKGKPLDEKPVRLLSPKTINNILTVLRRMLVIARKRGLIEHVPEFEWLKGDRPEFDFFDFDEAKRLVAAAEGEWRTMILVALRTGMRIGELLALRWEDVDLNAGRITVRRNVVWGYVGTPKSGKPREIPLSNDALAALKSHRHLRGPLVFCDDGGHMLTEGEVRHPLWRACKRAGLRQITWHVCRHTFASHLVMRGVPIKAVQELMGHSTILITMRYAHLAPEVSREAVQLLDLDAPVGQSLGRAIAKTA
jgi:integrase